MRKNFLSNIQQLFFIAICSGNSFHGNIIRYIFIFTVFGKWILGCYLFLLFHIFQVELKDIWVQHQKIVHLTTILFHKMFNSFW